MKHEFYSYTVRVDHIVFLSIGVVLYRGRLTAIESAIDRDVRVMRRSAVFVIDAVHTSRSKERAVKCQDPIGFAERTDHFVSH
jgi:hypothetical protein